MPLCKFADGDLCELILDLNIFTIDVSYKARYIKGPGRHLYICGLSWKC